MESKINVCVRMKPLSKTEGLHDKNKFWQRI
jgi:hypothetical protein